MRKAHATIYVGIDVSKDRLAVATAGGERQDEVLSLGRFENTPASVDKLLKKLAGRGDISVCYEAGPTGWVTSDASQGHSTASCGRTAPSGNGPKS